MPPILPAALRALFAGLVLVLLLSACGLKGDLVLPDAPAATPAPPAPEPGEDPESEDEGEGT